MQPGREKLQYAHRGEDIPLIAKNGGGEKKKRSKSFSADDALRWSTGSTRGSEVQLGGGAHMRDGGGEPNLGLAAKEFPKSGGGERQRRVEIIGASAVQVTR